MVKNIGFLLFLPIVLSVAACSPTAADKHEVGCVAGTMTGVALGGLVGNQFGGGRGNAILTGAGAIAGGAAVANATECTR